MPPERVRRFDSARTALVPKPIYIYTEETQAQAHV